MSVKKDGKKRRLQRWRCRECGHVWLTAKDRPQRAVQRAYKRYCEGRQTLADLNRQTGKSMRTLRRNFDRYEPFLSLLPAPDHPVALTFDATFFGRGYGLLIYRAMSRNIHWQEIVSERLQDMEAGLGHLQARGWRFSSMTIDGRKGAVTLIERLFPGMPVQMCLFHQKAIIRRYTTGRPKTECGKAIRTLSQDLCNLSEKEFLDRLQEIRTTHGAFLKERNEQNQFRHRRLRSALRSLRCNAPYLFTHKKIPELKIPTTTNSCDGAFAHWKNKVKIHRGLRRERRSKMIRFLLSNC